MPRGLQVTLGMLAATRNEAAASVLVPALDAEDEAVRLGALRALLARRSPNGHRELVARWHAMPEAWKAIVVENPGQLAGAIRDAILAADAQLCASGCDAALRMGEYDLIPALIQVAEADSGPRGNLAAHTLDELAQRLYGELAAGRDWTQRRDPQLFRAHVVTALELSIGRYVKHGRREILEAFLMLAPRDNAALQRVLQDPLDRCHVPMVELLTHSSRPAIARLALSFLEDPRAPRAALNVLAYRDDDKFLQRLMRKIGCEPSGAARTNLRRMKKIVWLAQDQGQLLSLDDAAQHAAVQAAVCSGIGRQEKFDVLRLLLMHGKPGGRRAAAAALAEFRGVEANRLIVRALQDGDPHVQAAALGQLRERGLPGAMATLIEAIDNPEAVVQEAARKCLREFNFARLLSAFDTLPDDVRRHTGELVKKVDLTTPKRLAEEMRTLSRSRRLRAIEMAAALDLARLLEVELLELLEDEDHVVRMEAAAALAHCPTEKARLALREAMLDRSVAVQNAAERALEEMAAAVPRAVAKIDLGAISLPDTSLLPIGGGPGW